MNLCYIIHEHASLIMHRLHKIKCLAFVLLIVHLSSWAAELYGVPAPHNRHQIPVSTAGYVAYALDTAARKLRKLVAHSTMTEQTL